MKTIYEIRRENLRTLVQERGNSEVAKSSRLQVAELPVANDWAKSNTPGHRGHRGHRPAGRSRPTPTAFVEAANAALAIKGGGD